MCESMTGNQVSVLSETVQRKEWVIVVAMKVLLKYSTVYQFICSHKPFLQLCVFDHL